MIQSISLGENIEVLVSAIDEDEIGLSECLIGSRTTIYVRPMHIEILEHLVECLKRKERERMKKGKNS